MHLNLVSSSSVFSTCHSCGRGWPATALGGVGRGAAGVTRGYWRYCAVGVAAPRVAGGDARLARRRGRPLVLCSRAKSHPDPSPGPNLFMSRNEFLGPSHFLKNYPGPKKNAFLDLNKLGPDQSQDDFSSLSKLVLSTSGRRRRQWRRQLNPDVGGEK